MHKYRFVKISLFTILISVSINITADSFFDKPFPICSSIKSYLAYEMSVAVKERCDEAGVVMKIKNLHNFFNSKLSSKEASPTECRVSCAILNTTEGMSMGDCVENIKVAPFVDSMMQNGTFNANTCRDVRNRM